MYGDCYGVLFVTFRHSKSCAKHFVIIVLTHQESQTQCILHVMPANSDVNASIGVALQAVGLDDFNCEACGGKGARQQNRLDDLPSCLIVHSNKHAVSFGPSICAFVHCLSLTCNASL